MKRYVILPLLTVLGAAPALAQNVAPTVESASSNPNAVVWDGALGQDPSAITFELGANARPVRAPLRLETREATAAPGSWSRAAEWSSAVALDACAAEGVCEGASGPLAENFDLRVRNDGESLQLGALVRFGENLSAPREDEEGWQFFAAADAHALTWDPNSRDGDSVRLREQRLLGDAQAGISRELAGGDFAIGFVHREISYEGASADEQFGGVTFVLTR